MFPGGRILQLIMAVGPELLLTLVENVPDLKSGEFLAMSVGDSVVVYN